MKTFEEKWTAWIDGELSGQELAEFEASLPDTCRRRSRKAGSAKTRRTPSRNDCHARAMGNEEFFNHQLRERIAREDAARTVSRSPAARPRFAWPIGRLVWSGATALAIFWSAHFSSCASKEPSDQSQYLSQILNARVGSGREPGCHDLHVSIKGR